MLKKLLFALLFIAVVSGLVFFKFSGVTTLGEKNSFDLDGDGKIDLVTTKKAGSVNSVKFKGRDTSFSYSPGKGIKVEVITQKSSEGISGNIEENRERETFEFKESSDFEKFLEKLKKERTGRKREKIFAKSRDIIVSGGEITVKKGNKTILFLDAPKKEAYINSDGDEKFEVKIASVNNETVTYEDKDGDMEGDVAFLAGRKIIYNLKSNTIAIDLNRNGVYDATVSINGGNYTVNYLELASFFGPEIINLLKSGNFTPEALETQVLEVLKKKDPELYRFVIKHRADIFSLLNAIKEHRLINLPAVFLLDSVNRPEDTIKLYYSLVCNEKDPSMLFSSVVDRSTVSEIHRAVYAAFDYADCKVTDISCKEVVSDLFGDTANYTLCHYRFSAKVRDRKGREKEIGGSYTTLLDDSFAIIWTEKGVIAA